MADAPENGPEDESVKKGPVRQQSSLKQPIPKQFGKPILMPDKPTINIGRNIPPNGSDLILYSCDAEFSVGPMQSFVLDSLDAAVDDKVFIESDDSYEIRAVGELLLAGIVSIPNSNKNTQSSVAINSEDLIHENLHKFLLAQRLGFINSRIDSVWIPLLGTGSAGLSLTKSAEIIKAVIDIITGLISQQLKQINIALPKEISDEDEAKILEIFGVTPSEPPIDSSDTPSTAMPGYFYWDRPVKAGDDDVLGRNAIARIIGSKVGNLWRSREKDDTRPYAVHLSGRWGSGKSSILNFLEEHLRNDKSQWPDETGRTHQPTPKGWIVVNYNAWQMQDAGPAWWSLRNAVASQGYSALGWWRGPWLCATDWCWRRSQMLRPWLWVAFVFSYSSPCRSSSTHFPPRKNQLAHWG